MLSACCAGACCGLAAANAAGGSNNNNNNNNNNNTPQQQAYSAGDHRNPQSQGGGDYYATPPSGEAMKRDNFDFEECARRAKQEVESLSKEQPFGQGPPPFSGQYSTSYVDRTTGVPHDAMLNLNLTSDFRGQGFKLSGEGYDIDGKTVIEDGHANYDGTAWWKERTVTRDLGLRVLSRGKFDFVRRTFNGTWMANTMEHGAYMTFQAADSVAVVAVAQPLAPPGGSIPVVSDAQIVDSGSHSATIPVVSATAVSFNTAVVQASSVPTVYVPPANPPTVYIPR
jgi:hypothetical protein